MAHLGQYVQLYNLLEQTMITKILMLSGVIIVAILIQLELWRLEKLQFGSTIKYGISDLYNVLMGGIIAAVLMLITNRWMIG